jgi:hypothetical protein
MTRGTAVAAIVLTACIALALSYLRDPPWLLHTESGFRGWQQDADGRRWRWTGGHASFFVPSTASEVRIPVRTVFDQPGDWPITVSIAVDDRPADRITLSDDGWHASTLQMPSPDRRRTRRIDIRADRTRPGNRAVQIGEVQVGASR